MLRTISDTLWQASKHIIGYAFMPLKLQNLMEDGGDQAGRGCRREQEPVMCFGDLFMDFHHA
jgi:hypothetical protein